MNFSYNSRPRQGNMNQQNVNQQNMNQQNINQQNVNQQNMNQQNVNQQNMNQQNVNQQNMNQQNSSFETNPKLKSINPIKLKIITEIKEQSKTKSLEELLPEILKINQELNRRNMNFTKEETNLLLESLEETLSPAERKKFNIIKSFL